MMGNPQVDPRRVLLPNAARRPRLIVCERSGAWATALRREIAPQTRIVERRTLAEARELLASAPASFVVLELRANQAEALVEWLGRLEREFPLARAAVVADRGFGGWEWLMRENGAVDFTCSPRRLAPLAAIARRHLDAVPSPAWGMVEWAWASLPWGDD